VIKKVLVLIVALPVLTGVVSVFAQDSLSNQPKNKLGFATGIGVQYLSQLFGADRAGPNVASNYYYHVRFYELQYYRTISKNKLYELDLLVQPQYNIARYGLYPESTDYFDAYEFGLNLGVLYRKHIANTPLNWYASLSTGPHYAETDQRFPVFKYSFDWHQLKAMQKPICRHTLRYKTYEQCGHTVTQCRRE
jgi:hypothetical protein